MRPTDPVIILIGRTIMNLGKYIVYNIMLILRKGDDYLSDRMPIWFSNTRYYENKRIVDNALEKVYRVRVSEQMIKDFKGTDHTPLDLGYRQKEEEKAKRFRDNEFEGDNFPDVVMNGNWKQVQR
tara:strand:+ start:133 stop:507 length:375 start_codon:yes stop_codon:yes gene_type:complete